MPLNVVRFFAVFLVALDLIPSGAHLLELPHKLDLPADAYRTVQELYRGWAFAGALVVAALLASLLLCVRTRGTAAYAPALITVVSLLATQVIFWSVTFAVNRITANWTLLPEHWEILRLRWEYSHATACIFNLTALMAVICAALVDRR